MKPVTGSTRAARDGIYLHGSTAEECSWANSGAATAKSVTSSSMTVTQKTSTVQLDTTLAELYRRYGIDGRFIVTMYCVFGRLDLHPNFPRELVWPEDEEPVPFSDDAAEQARLRRIILGLKPLRRAWGLGPMEVLCLGPNVAPAGLQRALNQLPPHQRHVPRFIDLDAGDVAGQLRAVTQDRTLLFWRPQGWMRDHACLVDPQEAYDINSKAFLLQAGIKTPPSALVNLQTTALGGDDASVFATRPTPFVVKLCRAGCGFGTYLVTSEAKREKTLAALAVYKQRGVTDVLVSDYVELVEDLAVHFLVGAPGSERDRHDPLILGVTVQTLTGDGKWTGGHIDYSAQARLQAHVRATLRDTTARLPAGFVGWAGVDIVVDARGEQYVVDLNARFTGSMPICLMSGHFWRERGLPLAQFAAFAYPGRADDVFDRLQPLVALGQVVVTATARIDDAAGSMADVVWGGRDPKDLARVEAWIRKRLAAQPRTPFAGLAEP